jgi:hypothetical protein
MMVITNKQWSLLEQFFSFEKLYVFTFYSLTFCRVYKLYNFVCVCNWDYFSLFRITEFLWCIKSMYQLMVHFAVVVSSFMCVRACDTHFLPPVAMCVCVDELMTATT